MCCCTIHAAGERSGRNTTQLAALVADGDTLVACDGVDCSPRMMRRVENSGR